MGGQSSTQKEKRNVMELVSERAMVGEVMASKNVLYEKISNSLCACVPNP